MGGANFGCSPVAKNQRCVGQLKSLELFSDQSEQYNMFSGSNIVSEAGIGFEPTTGLRDGVEDIGQFFCASPDDWNAGAADWDRSQFQQRGGSLGFGGSSSEGDNVIVIDSSVHGAEMYPFLSSSPSSPLGLQKEFQSSPLSSSTSNSGNGIERTSALPLPSVQANFYGNSRGSNFHSMH